MMMTCPSCQTEVEATCDVCPTCGWKLREDGGSVPFTVQASRPKIPVEVTIAFDVDRTGSSAKFRKGIPKTAEIICKRVDVKARELTTYVFSHGDLDEGQQPLLHTDGEPYDVALADIRAIDYGGGGDPPEHHLDGLEHVLRTVPWPADPSRSRGAVVAMMTADTKPHTSGLTASELGEMIKRQGLFLCLVCEPTPTLKQVADAAGGLLFRISNDPDAEEIDQVAAQVAASVVASISGGGTVPLTSPIAQDNA